jgi:hypothetical protein
MHIPYTLLIYINIFLPHPKEAGTPSACLAWWGDPLEVENFNAT